MKKIFSLAFIVLVSFCHAVFSDEISAKLPESPYQMVAPVFGSMVANQLYDIWESAPQDIRHSDIQLVIWEKDAGILAHDVMSGLYEKKYATRKWRRFAEQITVDGITTNQDESDRMAIRNERFSHFKAVHFDAMTFDQFSNLDLTKPVWIVVVCSSDQVQSVENAALGAHGEVILKSPLVELEFLKGDEGRQLLDLGAAKNMKLIFERLVARSVNPLEAKAMAQRAVDAFRANKETSLVVIQLK